MCNLVNEDTMTEACAGGDVGGEARGEQALQIYGLGSTGGGAHSMLINHTLYLNFTIFIGS